MSDGPGILLGAGPPWWYGVYESPSLVDALVVELEGRGGLVRTLRGASMRMLDGVFNEVAAALEFPEYFGQNWDALDECLADLSWLPASAYVLLFRDSFQVLADEPNRQLEILLQVLDRVAAEWSLPVAIGQPWDRPAVPFHVEFCEAPGVASALSARFEKVEFALDLLPSD